MILRGIGFGECNSMFLKYFLLTLHFFTAFSDQARQAHREDAMADWRPSSAAFGVFWRSNLGLKNHLKLEP